MSYEVYWRGDPTAAIAYRKADKLKQRRETERLWLQGAYIYNIMLSVAPTYNSLKPQNPLPYMEHPIPVSEAEANEYEKQKMIEAAAQFAKFADSWKGGENNDNRQS